MRKLERIVLFAALIFSLTSCATQPVSDGPGLPGFWFGLMHGIISPVSLLGGLFGDVEVYAFPNSGWWYNFGFMTGVGSVVGVTVESISNPASKVRAFLRAIRSRASALRSRRSAAESLRIGDV
ncbi:MAG: hypothetical protein ACLQDV_17315 [Candidatus Binataceae bacterium]